jgi:amidohydrolase
MPLRLLAVLAGALALARPASAQDLAARIDAEVARHTPAITEIRHTLHQNPELSNREVATARLVAERLVALGLEVETGVAGTGVVAVLRGGRPGPVVAVRADMDALPVAERTDLPFRSTARGEYQGREVDVAHVCGHDVHTAVGLGVATVLSDLRADLPGTVLFLFQPAEEGPPPGEEGGARLMLSEGALEDPRPEAIFALHSFPQFDVAGDARPAPIGQVGWNAGPSYASSDHFIITIRGKQAHGAWPQLSVDPVVTAAQAILALQTIRSRNLAPTVPAVVTVGIVRGGERNNIIPEEVRLEGTVRTYDEDVRKQILERIEEILDGVTRSAGATFALEVIPYAPPVVNDEELSRRLRPTMERVVGAENVVDVDPVMGAEDFAWFAREVPGFYWRLGVVEEGTTSGALHTPDFRAGDGALPVGMRVMANLVVDYLRGAGR